MHKRFSLLIRIPTLPLWFNKAGFSIAHREKNRVNIPKMEEGCLMEYSAAFIGQNPEDRSQQ